RKLKVVYHSEGRHEPRDPAAARFGHPEIAIGTDEQIEGIRTRRERKLNEIAVRRRCNLGDLVVGNGVPDLTVGPNRDAGRRFLTLERKLGEVARRWRELASLERRVFREPHGSVRSKSYRRLAEAVWDSRCPVLRGNREKRELSGGGQVSDGAVDRSSVRLRVIVDEPDAAIA